MPSTHGQRVERESFIVLSSKDMTPAVGDLYVWKCKKAENLTAPREKQPAASATNE